ncbi:MAG: hypothetical protein AB1489_27335, partial [Acidobacteriota bacterium]
MDLRDSELQTDELLDGRYRITEKIGQGAMGSVYRALDERNLNHQVVVKVISSQFTSHNNESAQIRLLREKEASLRIT